MKWVVNGRCSEKDSNYILNSASGELMTIKYTNVDHTVRINSPKKINRKYFQEKYGWLKPGLIFKNEYGVAIGKLALSLWSRESGSVELYQQRFFYNIKRIGSKIGLTVFNNKKLKICETEIANEVLPHKSLKSPEEFSGILLSICWFITENANS